MGHRDLSRMVDSSNKEGRERGRERQQSAAFARKGEKTEKRRKNAKQLNPHTKHSFSKSQRNHVEINAKFHLRNQNDIRLSIFLSPAGCGGEKE